MIRRPYMLCRYAMEPYYSTVTTDSHGHWLACSLIQVLPCFLYLASSYWALRVYFWKYCPFWGPGTSKKTGKNYKITRSQAPQKSLNQNVWSKIMVLPYTCYWRSIMGSFAQCALLELKWWDHTSTEFVENFSNFHEKKLCRKTYFIVNFRFVPEAINSHLMAQNGQINLL